MTDSATSPDDQPPTNSNVDDRGAMERLRDRTDELELIISSLTIFALISAPGWLFDRFADSYTHLSTSLAIAGTVGISLLAGFSYGLAACFVVHLMARAYWVGLIGLRTVFPAGIRWLKTPGLGPLSRQYYRDTLPDLESVIEKTDRVASSLFAVISMLTLGVLRFGAILVVTLVVCGEIGSRMGYTNAGIGIGGIGLFVLFAGVPFLVFLLDAQLAGRVPRLQNNRLFVALIRLLRRVSDFAYPRRLILPVQLTLQTNTRPVIFYIALTLVVAVIVVIGNTRMAAWQSFTLSGEFSYLNASDVQQGFRSTYYEDMPSSLDRLRAWPSVDSFEQDGSFVRLFLPYHPLRDNLVLEQLCGKAEETPDRVNCLRQLWAVSIEGVDVPMIAFTAAERADIGMRGLVGIVPLAGQSPGMLQIEVVWNPDANEQDAPLDDRYAQATTTYVIPVAFSPGYERPVPETSKTAQ